MRPELEISQLIDLYSNGSLSQEEKLKFEQRLNEEKSFKEDYELQLLVNTVIVGASEQSLREKIKSDIEAKDLQKFRFKVIIGISVLILSTVMIYVYSNYKHSENEIKPKDSPQKQYDSSFKSPLLKIEKYQENSSQYIPKTESLNEPKNIDTLKPSIILEKSEKNIVQNTLNEIHNPANENSYVKVKEDPCVNFQLTVNAKISGTCKDASDGKIDLTETSAIEGGKAPYQISKNSGTSFSKTGISYGLNSGVHEFLIIDANGCSQDKTFIVPEKDCRQSKFVFNPEIGEVWRIPVKENSIFSLYIYNSSKEIVFQLNSTSKDNFEWQGTSSSGKELEAGLYAYVIEINNGDKEYGQVTIIR